MALMTWKEEYSVNIKVIDSQHKKLVDLLNQIYDATKVGKGKEVLAKILSELVSYTKVHFTTEEEFFKKFSYPGYLQHKNEHDKLTKQVCDFQDQDRNRTGHHFYRNYAIPKGLAQRSYTWHRQEVLRIFEFQRFVLVGSTASKDIRTSGWLALNSKTQGNTMRSRLMQ